jgi:hypothetical protein
MVGVKKIAILIWTSQFGLVVVTKTFFFIGRIGDYLTNR